MEIEHKQIIFFLVAIFGLVVLINFYLNGLGMTMAKELENFGKAPELAGIKGYINTEPIKLSDFKGKVILVDFWTYSCINCIRTIPYLNQWHEKYSDDGLVIIGVHTPEFDFEKDYDNVANAVKDFNIKYPVVLDNGYATWKAYKNSYWPRKYIVDADGNIRYDHIGEGAYEETEQVIQQLLEERSRKMGVKIGKEAISRPENAVNVNASEIRTPELYFGYNFARAPLGNSEGFNPDEEVEYKLPSAINPNLIYLEGKWKNNPDHMELVSDKGTVVLFYFAKDVNIVAGGNSTLEIFVNNFLVDESIGGDDAVEGKVSIGEQRLYSIVSAQDYNARALAIEISGKGFEIYTFTFG